MCYMAHRNRIGVREARQNLSVYLDRVKAGEALEITERGVPVALLAPLPGRTGVVGRLAAEGRATPARNPSTNVGPALKVALPRALTEILDDLRAD